VHIESFSHNGTNQSPLFQIGDSGGLGTAKSKANTVVEESGVSTCFCS